MYEEPKCESATQVDPAVKRTGRGVGLFSGSWHLIHMHLYAYERLRLRL